MEGELMLTGVGGQGMQPAIQVVAPGCGARGSQVVIFGLCGRTVRGGDPGSVQADLEEPQRPLGATEVAVGPVAARGTGGASEPPSRRAPRRLGFHTADELDAGR